MKILHIKICKLNQKWYYLESMMIEYVKIVLSKPVGSARRIPTKAQFLQTNFIRYIAERKFEFKERGDFMVKKL